MSDIPEFTECEVQNIKSAVVVPSDKLAAMRAEIDAAREYIELLHYMWRERAGEKSSDPVAHERYTKLKAAYEAARKANK